MSFAAQASTALSPSSTGRLRRVLYVADLDPSIKFGSIEEDVFSLANAFAAEGSLFLPLFPKPLDDESSRLYSAAGLSAECLDLRQFRVSTLWTLVRIIKSHRIDCIQWNFLPPFTNSYVWFLSILTPRIRHELTEHNSPPLNPRAPDRFPAVVIKRILLRRYAAIWAVSPFVKEYLETYRGWRGMRVFTYFINARRFCPDQSVKESVRNRLGDSEHFVALLVAYLIPEKGVDVALRAVASLPEHVRLWIVGDGPDRHMLERMNADLGIAHRVRFLGTQRNVKTYMQAADCLLCPSRWAEAAGLVNLEGQSCGLPVIASRVGGIPSLVQDGITGFLFPVEDSEQLAHYISKLAQDQQLTFQMSERARKHALEHFSQDRRFASHLNCYRDQCEPQAL